jgi:hypothetical protein
VLSYTGNRRHKEKTCPYSTDSRMACVPQYMAISAEISTIYHRKTISKIFVSPIEKQ